MIVWKAPQNVYVIKIARNMKDVSLESVSLKYQPDVMLLLTVPEILPCALIVSAENQEENFVM
jgi:hypothetical protein